MKPLEIALEAAKAAQRAALTQAAKWFDLVFFWCCVDEFSLFTYKKIEFVCKTEFYLKAGTRIQVQEILIMIRLPKFISVEEKSAPFVEEIILTFWKCLKVHWWFGLKITDQKQQMNWFPWICKQIEYLRVCPKTVTIEKESTIFQQETFIKLQYPLVTLFGQDTRSIKYQLPWSPNQQWKLGGTTGRSTHPKTRV